MSHRAGARVHGDVIAEPIRLRGVDLWRAVALDRAGRPRPEFVAVRWSEMGAVRAVRELIERAGPASTDTE